MPARVRFLSLEPLLGALPALDLANLAVGVSDMKYQVLLEPSEEGVAVSVPGLPGCWSQGAAESEALANIASAIQEYVAIVKELDQGRDVPRSS